MTDEAFKDGLDGLYANGKVNGLLQAQVIVLEAARAYPNHRSVLQIVAQKIAGAIPPGADVAKETHNE